ncbi:MAG: hypothetical protein KY475_27740, partial [Planctomycetes bacterium]|nr:hypothetical protein [Planctomycetota bacterium]
EPIVNMAARFESNLDLKLAAAELGLKPQDFSSRLQGHPELTRVLGVVNAGGALKRDVFVRVFRDAVKAFDLGTPVGKVDTPTPDEEDLAGDDAPPSSAESGPAEPAKKQPGDPSLRLWTDATGKFQVRAAFVGFDDEVVRLRKVDRRVVGVPISKLSDEDQKFVLDQPPGAGFDLPPGAEELVARNTPPKAGDAPGQAPPGAPPGETPSVDPYQPLFGDNPYNPPEGEAYEPNGYAKPGPLRSPPPLKYPDATLYTWHPSTHEEFAGYFHDLEAGTLFIRLPNGIVLNGPVSDMSPEDLLHIKSITGAAEFNEQYQPPASAFGY